jgi:ABC-type transport system involved in cytochrome bd biosynthesis fused ATPase/permease subunit
MHLAALGTGRRELAEAQGALARRSSSSRRSSAELDPHARSAGERQLLKLVRAYISPARLVILDEATCHLDTAAAARVERAFADRHQKRPTADTPRRSSRYR